MLLLFTSKKLHSLLIGTSCWPWITLKVIPMD